MRIQKEKTESQRNVHRGICRFFFSSLSLFPIPILSRKKICSRKWWGLTPLPKIIDCYWGKILSIQCSKDKKKYDLLGKVVKSCLKIQTGAASLERFFSDNKNMFKSEGTNLRNETLMGLKRRCIAELLVDLTTSISSL